MTQRESDRLVALNKAGKKLLTPKQAAQCRSPHAVQPQGSRKLPRGGQSRWGLRRTVARGVGSR